MNQKLLTSIQSQVNAGFSPQEITQNLLKEGYTQEEVKQHLPYINKAKPASAAGAVSGWQVFVTIIALLVMVIRIARCY